MLRQYAIKEYGGLEADLPSTLPYGDTYLTSDTDKFYKYGQDGLPKEISGGAGGGDFLPLTGGTVTGDIHATGNLSVGENTSVVGSQNTSTSVATGSGQQVNTWIDVARSPAIDSAGSYTYGLVSRVQSNSTFEEGGLLGANFVSRLQGSGDASYAYGQKITAEQTGTGDVDFIIGASIESKSKSTGSNEVLYNRGISIETTHDSSGQVWNLQGMHLSANLTSGTAVDVHVALLDFDRTGGTVAGDFAYLQMQEDVGSHTVDGTARSINSLNTLPSYFGGEIAAKGFSVNNIQTAPASATDVGVAGEIRYTADAIYVCIATDTWKRTALETF